MPLSSASAPPGLAGRLREATRDLHAQVERAGLMPALLQGRLPRARYAALLRNLQAIYAALEEALARHADHPALAPLDLAPLARRARLAEDLALLDAQAEPPPLCPATERYVQRLRTLSAGDPALLAAHAYVRYLGDLNGGQALARLVARAYGLAAGRGTAFYDFGPSPGALVRRLRAAFDALPLEAATAERVVDEACRAFRRHAELFEQLDAPAALRPVAAGAQAGSSSGSCS